MSANGSYFLFPPRGALCLKQNTISEHKKNPSLLEGKTCKKFVKELNINNPLGPFNIPAWALKDSISVIAEPLCFLIIAFLNEGKFPSDLKQAHVCPIFKKGDTKDPNNYRPISIKAALSKVFEKVIREQISNYIDNNKLFPRYNLVSGKIYPRRMHWFSQLKK